MPKLSNKVFVANSIYITILIIITVFINQQYMPILANYSHSLKKGFCGQREVYENLQTITSVEANSATLAECKGTEESQSNGNLSEPIVSILI